MNTHSGTTPKAKDGKIILKLDLVQIQTVTMAAQSSNANAGYTWVG